MFNRFLTRAAKLFSTSPVPGVMSALGAVGGTFGTIVRISHALECDIGTFELLNAAKYNCTATGNACHELLPIAFQDIHLNCSDPQNAIYLYGNATNYGDTKEYSPENKALFFFLPIAGFFGGMALGILMLLLYRHCKKSGETVSAAMEEDDIEEILTGAIERMSTQPANNSAVSAVVDEEERKVPPVSVPVTTTNTHYSFYRLATQPLLADDATLTVPLPLEVESNRTGRRRTANN
jgi:hypothetical protein